MDNFDDDILEVERLLGLTTRQLVRTRLVLLLSDLQKVCRFHVQCWQHRTKLWRALAAGRRVAMT